MTAAIQKEFFLEDDPQINGEKNTVVTLMLPSMVLTSQEHYFLYLFMKHLKESNNNDWENWSGDDLISNYDDFVKEHFESLETQFKEFQPFNTDTIGIKFSGNFPEEKDSEERCEQLEKFNNKITNLTADVGRPLPVTMEQAYLDLIKKKHYGNKRLDEVMTGQTMNAQNLEEHMEQEKQEKRRQAREERRRVEALKTKGKNPTSETDANAQHNAELNATMKANNDFMNSVDPWMQRKEEQIVEEMKRDAVEEGDADNNTITTD